MKNSYCALILVLLIFGSCSKEENTEVNNTTTDGATFYFYGTLDDGTKISFETGESNYTSSAGYNNASNGSEISIEQSFQLSNSAQTSIAGASISQNFNSNEENCNNYRSMFETRNYGYGHINFNTEGASIFYMDANGKYWTTYQGGGAQNDGSFKIISQQNGSYGLGYNGITEAEFECTLYDQVGNWIKLTDGRIRSYSVQCFN